MVDDESGSEDFRIQVEVVDDSGRLLLDDPPYPEGLTRAISLASDDAIIGTTCVVSRHGWPSMTMRSSTPCTMLGIVARVGCARRACVKTAG